MKERHSAASLHHEYRSQLENAVEQYNRLMTTFPLGSFPKYAARIWRLAALAEGWGAIATVLCMGEKDYLEDWRTGK